MSAADWLVAASLALTALYIVGMYREARRRATGATARLAAMPVRYAEPLALTDVDVARWRGKLAPVDEHGCRLWTDSVDASGYGQMTIAVEGGRRTVKAHLVAWAVEVGDFPPGLEPDHSCEREACTTVDHLEWVTHAENMRRMAERSTHCQSGRHRWDEQDPVRGPGGRRECRPCRNERKRDRYAQTGSR